MTNYQKALHHLAEAEKWQRQVVSFEETAYIEAARATDAKTHQDALINQSILLKDHFWYKRAIANRNAHQTQATMYAAIATMQLMAVEVTGERVV